MVRSSEFSGTTQKPGGSLWHQHRSSAGSAPFSPRMFQWVPRWEKAQAAEDNASVASAPGGWGARLLPVDEVQEMLPEQASSEHICHPTQEHSPPDFGDRRVNPRDPGRFQQQLGHHWSKIKRLFGNLSSVSCKPLRTLVMDMLGLSAWQALGVPTACECPFRRCSPGSSALQTAGLRAVLRAWGTCRPSSFPPLNDPKKQARGHSTRVFSPPPRRGTTTCCGGFQSRKMKRRGFLVNHSKARRETKWGPSHGQGLAFSQLESRGSMCFRPLSEGWLDFLILGILL